MGLVSLTFGEGRNSFSVKPYIEVIRPEDVIEYDATSEPKFEVVKVSTFYGSDEVYLVGKVIAGKIEPRMQGCIGEKTFRVEEINSKYPKCTYAKQGMTVGMSTQGLCKDDIQPGTVISFSFGKQ
ncbi:MAG: hypothetical protein HY393_00795 [Candidatus Diapherotrites archaeon]|nr:hypothetical protein [Candidatus Diapherotrites archaeon]